jgi:hypothetical protein
MSAQRKRGSGGGTSNTRRRRGGSGRDFWGADDLDEADEEFVYPIDDPGVLIRSLGPPPLPGYETAAEYYFAAVYDKATNLAIALAAASCILADDEDDED